LDLPTNPFAVLTFISAPAVLTNASCVLLFGTGNRYGRAIDRIHELAELIETRVSLGEPELRLRIRQLEAGEVRTSLIVRAMTSFYTSVASFVASTLVSLVGALLSSAQTGLLVTLAFTIAFVAGTLGVVAMITGATMLVWETRFSLRVLREEKNFLMQRVHERAATLASTTLANKI
jgi:hypothetical protein